MKLKAPIKLAVALGLVTIMNFNTVFAQNMTMEQLKTALKYKDYHPDVLEKFLESINKLENTPNVFEHIPSEIISRDLVDGRFALNAVYQVKGAELIPITLIPGDENFLQQLNKVAPKGTRFIYNIELWGFGHVTGKREDGYYLIKNHATSYSPYPGRISDDIVLMDMEYITKDFKTFELVKYKLREDKDWNSVK